MKNIDHQQTRCEDCGELNVTLIEADFDFRYGIGKDEVTLVARVPMWHCQACGFEWTAPGAEQAQNGEISAYLGRMRPSEIRDIRNGAGLTQAQFASKLQVGEASLKRWETGRKVPSRSSNKLLVDFRAALGTTAGNDGALPMRRFRTDAPRRRLRAALAFDMSTPFPLGALG